MMALTTVTVHSSPTRIGSPAEGCWFIPWRGFTKERFLSPHFRASSMMLSVKMVRLRLRRRRKIVRRASNWGGE